MFRTAGGEASFDEIIKREGLVRDAFVARMKNAPAKLESGTTSARSTTPPGNEEPTVSISPAEKIPNSRNWDAAAADHKLDTGDSVRIMTHTQEETNSDTETLAATQDATKVGPESDEEQTIIPIRLSSSITSSDENSPQKKRPPFRLSSSLELKQIALENLNNLREGEVAAASDSGSTGGQSVFLFNTEGAESVEDKLERVANQFANSKHQNGLVQSLAEVRLSRKDMMPSGLRSLYPDTPREVTPSIWAAPSAKDVVKFPVELIQKHWKCDVVFPAIVHALTKDLPKILIMESKTECWYPEEPQMHGALLHVSLPTTTWPVMDDMPVFTANKRGTQFTYVGQYRTPRNLGWDNEPFAPDMLKKDAITALPEKVKDSVVSKVWEYGASGKGYSADYAKALAAHFFSDIYYGNTREVELSQTKENLMTKLKTLEEEVIETAFEKDPHDTPLGLRFEWVTLEAMGWDQIFYEKLIKLL
ncbi:MAG: hypothetical protein M1822_004938 [Bathelium mastoideum]|nr:MAG: hypothetical protein M1822_004938 [Bathelium mastoideum]